MDNDDFERERADTITRGAQAEALLTSQEFVRTIQELEQSYTDRMIATDPNETASRDANHYMILALQSIVANLTARVGAKQSLEDQLAFMEEVGDIEDI